METENSEHALDQSSFLLGHHFLFKHPGTDQELSPNCWAFGTVVMGGTAQTEGPPILRQARPERGQSNQGRQILLVL